jgi:hypothetical protein
MNQGYTNTLKQGSAPEATGRRLFQVKRVSLTVRRSLPVFPEKRTSLESVGTLQTRQYRHPNIGRPASCLEERPF